MGHKFQAAFLTPHVPQLAGPILEVGSKSHGNGARFRPLFPDLSYTGLDLESGPNVDVVGDLSLSLCGLEPGYGTIISASVLEHCRAPLAMARNMVALARSGGHIYVSVPWVWRWHPYPNDFWRFSHTGIRLLFDGLPVVAQAWCGLREGELIPITMKTAGYDDTQKVQDFGTKFLPYLSIETLFRKP